MARYPRTSYGRRTGRFARWIYTLLTLIIAAVVVAVIFGYNPFAKKQNKNITTQTKVLVPKPQTQNKILPKNKLAETTRQPQQKLPQTPTNVLNDSNSLPAKLITKAMDCINAKPPRIIEARNILNEALPIATDPQQRKFIKDHLSHLADRWLFSRTIFPQDTLCGSYEVKRGDQLRTIGQKFKVPWEILSEINKVSPKTLPAGKMIKVIYGPFHTKIYRSTFTMDLYLQNMFVRSFSVGLGMPGRETPTGLWVVEEGGKLIKPTWYDELTGKTYQAEDPNYPLGSRWIGLKGVSGDAKDRIGFAIHGTKDANEIGAARSRGCIRLHNGDAILVYNLLVPRYSQVEVLDEPPYPNN